MTAIDWAQIIVIPLITTLLTLGAGYFAVGRQHKLDMEQLRVQQAQALEQLRVQQEQALERMRVQWRLDLDLARRESLRQRIDDLKDQAGYLYDNLRGWSLNQPHEAIQARFGEVRESAGRYAEYADVYAAIQAFLNTTGWILDRYSAASTTRSRVAFPDLQEREQVMSELHQHYKALTKACDRLINETGAQVPAPEERS